MAASLARDFVNVAGHGPAGAGRRAAGAPGLRARPCRRRPPPPPTRRHRRLLCGRTAVGRAPSPSRCPCLSAPPVPAGRAPATEGPRLPIDHGRPAPPASRPAGPGWPMPCGHWPAGPWPSPPHRLARPGTSTWPSSAGATRGGPGRRWSLLTDLKSLLATGWPPGATTARSPTGETPCATATPGMWRRSETTARWSSPIQRGDGPGCPPPTPPATWSWAGLGCHRLRQPGRHDRPRHLRRRAVEHTSRDLRGHDEGPGPQPRPRDGRPRPGRRRGGLRLRHCPAGQDRKSVV